MGDGRRAYSLGPRAGQISTSSLLSFLSVFVSGGISCGWSWLENNSGCCLQCPGQPAGERLKSGAVTCGEPRTLGLLMKCSLHLRRRRGPAVGARFASA